MCIRDRSTLAQVTEAMVNYLLSILMEIRNGLLSMIRLPVFGIGGVTFIPETGSRIIESNPFLILSLIHI